MVIAIINVSLPALAMCVALYLTWLKVVMYYQQHLFVMLIPRPLEFKIRLQTKLQHVLRAKSQVNFKKYLKDMKIADIINLIFLLNS